MEQEKVYFLPKAACLSGRQGTLFHQVQSCDRLPYEARMSKVGCDPNPPKAENKKSPEGIFCRAKEKGRAPCATQGETSAQAFRKEQTNEYVVPPNTSVRNFATTQGLNGQQEKTLKYTALV